ncbi:CYTH and CHAD domain-containing protein [Actinoplanes sp. NBRC 103695]|uniref:CYTH and CHAD domain-containing protein n=1 Tax=Actinoplanes sp. NBRC 103695 TaxID=3032202 RepID=UPI002554EE1A|nr:CYTH and CHAD domain-containing protein [Actinoplanes sp. NBRC 103695]
MQISTETERKYDVPADFVLPDLPGAADGATHDLDATYFDTTDLRLARHQRTLRRRTGGDDAGWHLKTPGDGSSRTEHRMPLDGEDVPDDLLTEVRAIVRDTPVRPVARLRTHRLETPVRDAKGRIRALIAQDTVTAETDDGTQTWQEVEVELTERGDSKLLDEMERLLLAAGASPAEGPSKLARALAARLAATSPRKRPKIKPVLAYVREQRDAILEHDPGVRHGDAEAVHKMRVGTRRLRSTLKTFKRSFPPDAVEFLKAELKWLAGSLGEVRDGQVLEHKLLAAVRDAGDEFAPVADQIRDHLEAKVTAGTAQLADDLNGERYFRLLDAIDELIAGWDGGESKPLRRVRKALDKADRLLDEATLAGADEPLHEARKSYKQARYAVEVFAPEAGKPGKQLVKRLTDLQDVLGTHQDSVVAQEILRSVGDGFPHGVLWERQAQIGRDTLGELPLATRASRKRELRSWLG